MGQLVSQFVGGRQQAVVLMQAVKETPGLAFLGIHGAARQQQFAGAPLADHARQQGTGAHVGARQAHTGKEESHSGRWCAQAQVAGQGHHGAGSGTHPIQRGHDGLWAGPHGCHQGTRHAGKSQQLGHGHLGEWADDFMHITPGAKIAACTRQHHRLDIGGALQTQKPIAQFGIRVEGQRVFTLGSVEGDSGHPVGHAQRKVLRLFSSHLTVLIAHRVVVGNGVFHAMSC